MTDAPLIEITADGVLAKNCKVLLNGEDITQYIKNINVDIGVDRVTTATIVLSARAVIQTPAILKTYIRKEDRVHE